MQQEELGKLTSADELNARQIVALREQHEAIAAIKPIFWTNPA